jgi:hypothetical protein
MIQELLKDFESTFRDDFSIADRFGKNGILDTYKRAFNEWKNDKVFITELSMVLNWKCWYWYDNDRKDYSELYQELWEKTHDWCLDNLK